MSSISNIVSYDNGSTAHTFVPVSVTRTGKEVIAVYRENSSSISVNAQPRITLSLKEMNSGVYRVSQRTEVPVAEAIGTTSDSDGYIAPPKTAYVDTMETIGFFAPRSTSAGRAICRNLHCNVLNGVITANVIPATGPVYELFTLLVAPT